MSEAFKPTNQLERLLAEATNDPAARPAFYRALGDNDLYVVDHDGRLKLDGNVPEGTPFQLRMLEVGNKICVPVFTSAERIGSVVNKETQYFATGALSLFQRLEGQDLILNPGFDCARIMPKEEVAAVLDGSIFGLPEQMHRGGRELILGEPAEYPREMADALARYFATLPQVKAAYLALATWPESEDPPSIMIGIQVQGDPKQALEGAGMILNDLKPRLAVDMFPIRSESAGFPSDDMIRHIKPFYRRKIFGIF